MPRDLEMDRQPHRETKAVFKGKARGRDGQAKVPENEDRPAGPDRTTALGTRNDWYRETSVDGPDVTTTITDYAGLAITTRLVAGLHYRLTFHCRSFTADTTGYGFAIYIRDAAGSSLHAVLGPKVTAANVGEGGGTFTWVWKQLTSEYVTRKVSYERISGAGTGHIQATGLSKTHLTLEIIGNISEAT